MALCELAMRWMLWATVLGTWAGVLALAVRSVASNVTAWAERRAGTPDWVARSGYAVRRVSLSFARVAIAGALVASGGVLSICTFLLAGGLLSAGA